MNIRTVKWAGTRYARIEDVAGYLRELGSHEDLTVQAHLETAALWILSSSASLDKEKMLLSFPT